MIIDDWTDFTHFRHKATVHLIYMYGLNEPIAHSSKRIPQFRKQKKPQGAKSDGDWLTYLALFVQKVNHNQAMSERWQISMNFLFTNLVVYDELLHVQVYPSKWPSCILYWPIDLWNELVVNHITIIKENDNISTTFDRLWRDFFGPIFKEPLDGQFGRHIYKPTSHLMNVGSSAPNVLSSSIRDVYLSDTNTTKLLIECISLYCFSTISESLSMCVVCMVLITSDSTIVDSTDPN